MVVMWVVKGVVVGVVVMWVVKGVVVVMWTVNGERTEGGRGGAGARVAGDIKIVSQVYLHFFFFNYNNVSTFKTLLLSVFNTCKKGDAKVGKLPLFAQA